MLTIAPPPWFVGLDETGRPLAGGKLYTYAALTGRPLPVYRDPELTEPHTNPVILDAAGRAVIYLLPQAYRWELRTADDRLVYPATIVHPIPPLGEFLVASLGGDPTAGVTATSYPVGASLASLHPGTGIFRRHAASLVGLLRIEAMLRVTGGSADRRVSVGLVNLSVDPERILVELGSSSQTGELVASVPIRLAEPPGLHDYGIKSKVAGTVPPTGYAWSIHLVKVA